MTGSCPEIGMLLCVGEDHGSDGVSSVVLVPDAVAGHEGSQALLNVGPAWSDVRQFLFLPVYHSYCLDTLC